MNYIWSKKSLLDFIENSIATIVKEDDYIFSDLFAWTWIVWRYFKSKGHRVIANDLQYYSFVLNRNYIWNHTDLYFRNLLWEVPELLVWDVNCYKDVVLDYLNNLEWKQGFIYHNYSATWTEWKEFERIYFSDQNALRCDWIRLKIEQWREEEKINEDEYYFLLSSLLESIDKVANTASVYWAFLKQLKSSAKKSMVLKSADFSLSVKNNLVYHSDVNELIKDTSHDVVYLDPPYNQRQYSGNYHLLETIAMYDNPIISWKTWMRDCSNQKSLFCKKAEVKNSFAEIIQNIKAKYVFLSYNSEWLMSHSDIKEIMSQRWEYGVFRKKYKRFKADKRVSNSNQKEFVIEYLHYVIIDNPATDRVYDSKIKAPY